MGCTACFLPSRDIVKKKKKNSSVNEQFTPFILFWHILLAFSLFTQESSSGHEGALLDSIAPWKQTHALLFLWPVWAVILLKYFSKEYAALSTDSDLETQSLTAENNKTFPGLSFTMDTQPQELVLQLCWDNQWVTWQHRGPIEAHFPLTAFLFLLFSASVLSSLHLSRDCSQINWFDGIAVFDNMRKPMESVNASSIIQCAFATFIHNPACPT